MQKCKSSPKIELHKFLQILSHIQKIFETSNVEILRKVVNRHMGRQYML